MGNDSSNGWNVIPFRSLQESRQIEDLVSLLDDIEHQLYCFLDDYPNNRSVISVLEQVEFDRHYTL